MKRIYVAFGVFFCIGILYLAVINTISLHQENTTIQLLKKANSQISKVDDDINNVDNDVNGVDADVESLSTYNNY